MTRVVDTGHSVPVCPICPNDPGSHTHLHPFLDTNPRTKTRLSGGESLRLQYSTGEEIIGTENPSVSGTRSICNGFTKRV